MTELEKCMAGLPFTNDESTASLARNAKRLIKQLNELESDDNVGKRNILEQLFGSMGEHVHVDIDIPFSNKGIVLTL